MTILSYSGGVRGSGSGSGRGRGRGRGRGAGRGRGSGRGGGYSYRGGGGGGRSFHRGYNNYQNRSAGNSFAATGAPSPSKSTKWVRPKEDTTNDAAAVVVNEGSSASNTATAINDNSSSAPLHSRSVKQFADHHGMTKKGHNKLILSALTKAPPSSSSSLNVNQQESTGVNSASSSVDMKLEFRPDGKHTNTTTDDNQAITAFKSAVEGSDQLSESPHDDAKEAGKFKSTNLMSNKDDVLHGKAAMSRRGHNKLVLKTTRRLHDNTTQQHLHQILSDDSETNDNHDPVRNSAAGIFQPMKKLGHHKLVLNNTIKSNDKQNERGEGGEVSNEDRRRDSGTSKVSQSRGNDVDEAKIETNQFVQPPGHRSFHWNKNNHPNPSKRDRPFRRRNHQHHVPQHNVAKRIKVTVLQPSGSYDSDAGADEGVQTSQYQGGTTSNHSEKNEDRKKSAPQEKLTDFAYRETAPRTIATHKRSWGNTYHREQQQQQQQHPPQPRRNMGLVRVQPDVKKTPICPFYLKGIECTDKYCRKRHDVPKEAAIPICMFFQKHGQCLKGDDCVFRHIKVNSKALVCPNFSLLGFCDDKDCKMKHVRSGGGGGVFVRPKKNT